MLVEEFERTRRMVLSVTDQGELLKDNPVLARSIRLRNPYVDPMSLVQVELLRRKRAGGNRGRRGLRPGRDHQRHRGRPAQYRVIAI